MRPPRTGLHLIRRSSRPAAAGTVVAAALEGAGSGSGGDDARCNAPRTRQGSAARDPVLRSGSGRAVRGAVSRRGARRSHSPEVRMVACDLAGVGFEHRVEHRGVFRVPAPDQESQLLQPLTEVHRQVPGLLGDPAAGRVGRHAGDMQLPGRMPAKISTYKRLSSTCRCAGSHSGRYAAARGRSGGSYRTRGIWRRSTAFSWRRTSNSVSLDRSRRNSTTSRPSTERTIT